MTAKEWRTSPLGHVPKWTGSNNIHVYLDASGFSVSHGPRTPDLMTDDDARSLRDWLLELFPL